MSDALHANGIKGMTVCQWGVPYSSPSGLQGPAQWTPPLATSYRLSDDIANNWQSVVQISNQAMHIAKRGLSGPGHFADGDLLEVGNGGLTPDEERSHFSLWAMLKSNLMISTDLSKVKQGTLDVLTNKHLIAINQDPLGKPIELFQRYTHDHDVYSGPLANGDLAVLVVEQGNLAGSFDLDLTQFGAFRADVLDLWTGKVMKGINKYTAELVGHGCIALRLSNIVPPAAGSIKILRRQAESGQGGNRVACPGCSAHTKVGGLDEKTSLTFTGLQASFETSTLLFDYINAEVQYSFTGAVNERGAIINVNGGEDQFVSFPVSGYNWDMDVWKDYRVDLWNFRPGGNNTVTIRGGSKASKYAPDIDRIGIIVAYHAEEEEGKKEGEAEDKSVKKWAS